MYELIFSVLTLVVAFLIKLAFAYLNIEIDEGTFNAIVAGIVTWILSLMFANKVDNAIRAFRAARAARLK